MLANNQSQPCENVISERQKENPMKTHTHAHTHARTHDSIVRGNKERKEKKRKNILIWLHQTAWLKYGQQKAKQTIPHDIDLKQQSSNTITPTTTEKERKKRAVDRKKESSTHKIEMNEESTLVTEETTTHSHWPTIVSHPYLILWSMAYCATHLHRLTEHIP